MGQRLAAAGVSRCRADCMVQAANEVHVCNQMTTAGQLQAGLEPKGIEDDIRR